jgi:CDGSH-type Zn-finger protein/mannose-6-phosphate isomerase-like protein (cupin superfamily)
MSQPTIAHRKGFYYELKQGERRSWCSCGLSKSQPFCDGAHMGTAFKPVPIRAARDEDVIFCGCKHTKTPPFCDGAHSNLPGGYLTDDPDSPANRAIPLVSPDSDAVTQLDGNCYIFSTRRARLIERVGITYCAVISPAKGAEFQSQFYAEIPAGQSSPVITADQRHTVLFIQDGSNHGSVEISGQTFPFEPRNGIYIRPSEAYRIHNPGPDKISLFISNGPGSEDLSFLDQMPDNFQSDLPHRRSEIDPTQRQQMAERYFQLLINRDHGSDVVTQFIGNIPLSKAEPHRHLYEEALIFLNGSGVVWTETRKAQVGAGDVLFLPRKLLHSVQCTCEGGFDVVGVIYPGDNPAINY